MIRFFLSFFLLFSAFGNSNDFIVIEKDQVVDKDFYASASVIEISGVCKKDVYLSGTQILVDGVIEGDLICLAGALQISGEVKGSVRGLVGQTLIGGSVDKNVTLVSAAFTSTPTASFLSNVFLAASTADMSGTLAKDLFIGATHLRYGSSCDNNLHIYAGNIRLTQKAYVGGYVEYSSPNRIDIQPGAVIKGEVIAKKGPGKLYSRSAVFNNLIIGSKVAGVLMNLFFTVIIGIFLIKIWPTVFIRSLSNLKNHFLKSLVQGVIFLVVVPLLGLLLLITILGIPVAVTLIAFSVLGLYTAKIHTLYFLTEKLKHNRMKSWGVIALYTVLCIGYFILQLLPYVSVAASWLFTLAGLGASVYIPKALKKV